MAALECNNKIYLIIKKDCIACNIQLRLLENVVYEFNRPIENEEDLIQIEVINNEINKIPYFIQQCNIEFTDFPITIFTMSNTVYDIIYGTESVEKLQKSLTIYYK